MIHITSRIIRGFFRGVIQRGSEEYCTRKKFVNSEEAEAYALTLMLRFRSIFE